MSWISSKTQWWNSGQNKESHHAQDNAGADTKQNQRHWTLLTGLKHMLQHQVSLQRWYWTGSVLWPTVVINIMTSSSLEVSRLTPAYKWKPTIEGSQAPWRQRIEADSTEEHCLPACSPWLAQLSFLHISGPPAQVWHHPQAMPLDQSWRTCTHRHAHRPTWWRHSLQRSPLPRWLEFVAGWQKLTSTFLYLKVALQKRVAS